MSTGPAPVPVAAVCARESTVMAAVVTVMAAVVTVLGGLATEMLDAANKIYEAVDAGLAKGKFVSPDLGGKASTNEVTEDILKRL